MKFFYDYIVPMLIALSLAVSVLAAVFIPAFILAPKQCEQKAISFEDHRWGILSGCMVKHNGQWLPLDNIRGFDSRG